MDFVNQKLDRLGLSVQNPDTQVGTQPWGPQAGTGHGARSEQTPHRALGTRPAPCGLGGVTSQSLRVPLPTGWELQRASQEPRGTPGSGGRGSLTKGFIYAAVTSHCKTATFQLFFQMNPDHQVRGSERPSVLTSARVFRSVLCARRRCRCPHSPAAGGSPRGSAPSWPTYTDRPGAGTEPHTVCVWQWAVAFREGPVWPVCALNPGTSGKLRGSTISPYGD